MSEEFVLMDSKGLQMKSLCEFMKQLGYSYDNCGKFFQFPPNPKVLDKYYISFRTAIEMHNGTLLEWHGTRFFEPFDDFDFYEIVKARSAKIVANAHLQYSKKEKKVIVTQHLVKFVAPEYFHLFKGMLQ